MKFVMYNDNQPGILTDAGVIDIGDLCPGGGQAAIVNLITNYDDLKSQLETRAAEGTPVAGAQLQAPLPRAQHAAHRGAQVSPHLLSSRSLHSDQGRNLGPGEVACHLERRR